MFSFSDPDHAPACEQKRRIIADKVALYAKVHTKLLTDEDDEILKFSLAELVRECSCESLSPSAVLDVYAKQCVAAHAATNCLADLMFDQALKHYKPERPLSGVPISLKDCIDIAGYDTTLGYSSRANRPVTTSAPIVRLLQDAGALLHVKTTVPTGLLSFETSSDLFGLTTNPYNPKFSPGASTGGGGALLAYRGSKIEIASDLGGSVRFPAVYCGVYGMKATSGRFPSTGCGTSVPGLEGIQTTSPMANNLDDLIEFWERVVSMKPWEYDQTCVPIPWRSVDFVLAGRKPRWGVIWNDGLIRPTPACLRALKCAVDTLREQGYEVFDFDAPSPVEGLKIGFPLAFADGGQCKFGVSLLAPLRRGEVINPAISLLVNTCCLPSIVRNAVASYIRWFSRPAGRNDVFADLLACLGRSTASEERALIVRRDEYRDKWREAMRAQGIDFVMSVPHALPPMPKDGTGVATLVSANYAFLYNILDYPAGVVPVTFVDSTLDALPEDHNTNTWPTLNDAERAVWSLYDATAMDGLPLGVQIAGGRFEEEKVLEGMKLLDTALRDASRPFVPKEF
ncbi:hypothetical protein NM688_g666 [Phlebia brevispora]|uniref:Uncharacterized protein n=1 Tax=Phlebia brevispora TaxID=194682 RepID=A0ACC1TDV0_9APHY|nr:hypothetical protein NM688_g666 [Phlebia brevispora]